MKQKVVIVFIISMIAIANICGCSSNQQGLQEQNSEQKLTNSQEDDQNKDFENGEMTEKHYELKLPEYEFTRENFPRMDGSTSLVPLGKALAGNLLAESNDKVSSLANFNRTTQSYRNLMNGECDLLLASWPNEIVFDEMKENHFDYLMEEISTEALIFVVNENNPVNNLTTEQIKDIYSGKIKNWSEVGGNDEPIDAFQRNKGSGSQALMEKLIMQKQAMMDAPESYMIGGMGELMEAVRNYDNRATAIGYSVYYYANEMKMANGLKIISVDGVQPNANSIRKKEYPHTNAYYCVIAKSAKEDSPQRVIYDWLVQEEGQKLVAQEGYVSILDVGIEDSSVSVVPNRYTRISDAFIQDLKADPSYGEIYPFCGETLYTSNSDGYSWAAGNKYGIVDKNGRIVADPVYTEYFQLSYYDGENHMLPYWVLEKAINDDTDNPTIKCALASMDGSFVTECKYDQIVASTEGIMLRESYHQVDFEIIDFDRNVIATNENFKDFKPNSTLELSNGQKIAVYFDGLESYYFVDLKGNRLFGPYSYANAFNSNRAVVQKNEKSGVIDLDGKEIIPTEYDWVEVRDKNYIRASLGEMEYLFDYDGNKIEETTNASYFVIDAHGNYGILPGDDQVIEAVFYNKEKKPVYKVMANQEYQIGNSSIYYANEGQKLIIEDKISKKKKILDGFDGVGEIECMALSSGLYSGGFQDNSFYVAYQYTDTTSKEMLLDSNFEEVITANGSITSLKDDATGKCYFVVYEQPQGQYHIYTEQMEEVMVNGTCPFILQDKMFVFDEYGSTIMDMDGKILFSYAQIGKYGD